MRTLMMQGQRIDRAMSLSRLSMTNHWDGLKCDQTALKKNCLLKRHAVVHSLLLALKIRCWDSCSAGGLPNARILLSSCNNPIHQEKRFY